MKLQTLLPRMQTKGVKVTHTEFKNGEYLFFEESELIRMTPKGKRTVARIRGGLLYDNGWSVVKEQKAEVEVKYKKPMKKKKKKAASKKQAA